MLPGKRSERSAFPTSGSCWFTFSVRSNASSPFSTSSKISIALRMPKPDESTSLRNCLRVNSILRASEISSSRVSSGISPICVRYIRTGSSIFSVMSTAGAASSASVGSATSIPGVRSTSSLSSAPFFLPPLAPAFCAASSSTTSRPPSSIIAIADSMCSGDVMSSGITALSCASVTEPTFFWALQSALIFFSSSFLAAMFH